MNKKPFFITTPIYYGNGVPHIGHTYASLICDTIARYKRMKGFEVKFSTGIDENSQKIVEKAAEAGVSTMQYLDEMAAKHQEVWKALDITYTDYIRTTSAPHHEYVRKILQLTYDRGDIYQGEYEGLYCVGCEAFKKSSDLTTDGLCPDHLKAPITIKEKNWFFKLSKYQDRLLALYESNPDFVSPRSRFNEVIEFLKQEKLEDLSISRETSTFGIPLPFDESQVTYVWYDALLNYLTVCQGGDERFWPADLHVMAKDIIKFHAVYWPAMLMSIDHPIPKGILATGYFTNEWQKMSKSLGNVIEPIAYIEKYSRELLVNYLFSTVPIGSDGDFSEKESVLLFNAKLANNLGNLLNRFLVLSLKTGGEVPVCQNTIVRAFIDEVRTNYTLSMDAYDLRTALTISFELGDFLNKFVDTEKPWEKDIETNREEFLAVLSVLGEGLRAIGLMLFPFFEEKMSSLLSRIGLETSVARLKNGEFDAIFDEQTAFFVKEKGVPLFERIVEGK